MADWDWMDKDGSMFDRVQNVAAWEATLRRYCDLGCQKPKAQVQLTNVNEA